MESNKLKADEAHPLISPFSVSQPVPHQEEQTSKGIKSKLSRWWRESPCMMAGVGIALLISIGIFIQLMILLAPSKRPHVPKYQQPPPPDSSPCAASPYSCDYAGRPRALTSSGGVVASDQGRCSKIGARALKSGGNAVDAAVATAFCLGVVNSFSCGLGGGDFWTIRLNNGSSWFLNAREVAPASVTQDMFAAAPSGGPLSIAVPLSLKGLEAAWRRFGLLPWSRLVNPAANLASTGFDMHPFLRDVLVRNFEAVVASQGLRKIYLIRDQSTPSGYRIPDVGEDCCVNEQLASTLNNVAFEGAKALYSPRTAQVLASEIQSAGGLVSAADLTSIQVQWHPALYRRVGPSCGFYFPPPPSSASALILGFSILAGYNTSSSPALNYHRLVEALKHVFAVRANLGDPDFSNLTDVINDLLAPQFSNSLRSLISDERVLNQTSYGGRWSPFLTGVAAPPPDQGTTHVSVVDAQGNAVSLTLTLNDEFGSKFVSPSTGIIFNNEMDDFSRPGKNSATTSSPNLIQPGKRPLSSMSPLIVVNQGKLDGVIGGSGGTKIFSAILQTLARAYLSLSSNSSAQLLDIIASPRLHDPFFPLPDTLNFENYSIFGMDFRLSSDILSTLYQKGDVRQSASSTYLGIVQAVIVNGTLKTAVSDPRKDGAPSASDSV